METQAKLRYPAHSAAPVPPLNAEESERFVAQHLPLVYSLCARFSRSGVPLEDLHQVGSIGLFKAMNRFDPTQETPFAAFAVPRIVGEVKNYFRDHGWSVRIPRKIQRQKLAVARAVEALTKTLSRSPTVPEIANSTGFTEAEIYDVLDASKFGRPLSLEAIHRVPGSNVSLPLQDFIGGEDPRFDEATPRIDLTAALRRVNECCEKTLDEREKTIIRLTFYSEMTQRAIAKRLGM